MKTNHPQGKPDDDSGPQPTRKIASPDKGSLMEQSETRTEQADLRTVKAETLSDALRASELSYRRLFESARDGILILDADTGRIADVNPFLIELLGFSHGEMVGKTVGELSPFKDILSNQAMLERLQKDGYIRYEDLPLETRDGRHISVEFVSNVYQAGDKNVIQCNIRDVSDRKRAEVAMRERERLLREAQIIAKMGSYILDIPGGWWSSSEGLDALFGIGSKYEHSVAGWLAIVHPDDRAMMVDYLEKEVIARHQLFDKEYRIVRHSDQAERWVHGRGKLKFDAQARPLQMHGTIQDITERKQADAALRQSEERYNALFNRSLDCVFLTDFAGNFLDANQASLDLLGYHREEITSLTFASLLTDDQLPTAFQTVEEIKATGQQQRLTEFRLRGKDGRQVYVETQSSLIYREGKPFAIQGLARDITARKQTEEALGRERMLLGTLVEHLPLAVYLKDAAGRKTLSNPVDMKHCGVTSEADILGKTDTELFRRDQAAIFQADERRVITTGQPMFNREEQLTAPDGSIRWLLTSKVPLFDAAGCVTGLAGIGLDITERKQSEQALSRLATAVEQSAETIVITDTNGTILYANPAFEKSTGYTRAEALGQNPRLIKSGKQDAEFYRQMWDVLQRGEVWHGHFFNKRKDGKLYEEDATISPVRDAAGKIVNYVAVKRDVTRETQLEAQLRQTQKMEAIGTLAGGVAHDFNNILMVISMEAGLLKSSGGLTPEQEKYVDEINNTIERAAALTRQLLLFSRREVLQPRDLDWSEAVTNTTKMLRRILGENLEIQLNLPAAPMFIHADPGMLDQLLMNLSVNARDAMPNGGRLIITVTGVELDEFAAAQSAEARPGSFVCLSVADTGSGIPPEVLPMIFEPFFTTKGIGKGTGLGLATVFGIVQQHQGWINVYSEVGQGTTFKVYLPRLVGMSDQIIAQKMLATIPTGTETILLVEDEPALRATVQMSLTKLGYRVLEASTGVKALEVWKAHRAEIRLLLTDLIMPDGMTGKELGQRLVKKNPKLKVIYMSGYSADLIGKDFPLQEGVNFLTKPFQTQKLAQTIRDCLDKPAEPA